MGRGPTPTLEQLAIIEDVYCPLPSFADKAMVTFEEGMGISEFTVLHVDPNFLSTMSTMF